MVRRSSSSMMKQSGALMSSRLMPPKVGSSIWQARMTSWGSLAASSRSKTSMSAKRLNRTPLPSITGLPASGPIFPKPEHGRAVGHHGHQVALGGVAIGQVRLLLDFQTRNRDSRRIGKAEVALRVAGLGRRDGNLPGGAEAWYSSTSSLRIFI